MGQSQGASSVFSYIKQYGTDKLAAVCDIDQTPKMLNDDSWTYLMYGSDIILGGYMAEYIAPYIDDIKVKRRLRSIFVDSSDCIKSAECINEPVAFGAAIDFIISFINKF
ncbi:MAG: hypothetical protein HUJ66_03705 [Oscillospiraceae bacterium]|nr:hypothetical protein [Oscillospiraceae bacterium]